MMLNNFSNADICVSTLANCSGYLPIFEIGFLNFSLLICRNYLHIPEISPLLYKCKPLSQFISCLLTLLMMSLMSKT